MMTASDATSVKTGDIFLRKLLAKIEAGGLDVRRFRRSYLERRLATRLRATATPDYFYYYRYLESHPDELPRLLDALTVNVTEFFRNEEVFRAMENEYFPALIREKEEHGRSLIRIWSAGCSSGEEVFTLAMILGRCLERSGSKLSCTIYGTDVDRQCVARGRQAVYPNEELGSIPTRFRDYTVPQGPKSFTFAPKIKRLVRLKQLDLFVDKPIRLVDMVFCRNVLIYFDHRQQEELIARFKEALVPGGILTIGKSERFNDRSSGFVPIDRSRRIYQKTSG